MEESRIILALDDTHTRNALELISKVRGRVFGYKIHSLWDKEGPFIVAEMLNRGADYVWVDVKLHDIPRTVKARAQMVLESGASAVSVHAGGGKAMMVAAAEVNLEIFGITILTSLDEQDISDLYTVSSIPRVVKSMVDVILKTPLNGIVCSAQEVASVKFMTGDRDIRLIVPGTRSPGKNLQDQKRSATPAEAIKAGATHLVIGSQVINSNDPLGELSRIEDEIAAI